MAVIEDAEYVNLNAAMRAILNDIGSDDIAFKKLSRKHQAAVRKVARNYECADAVEAYDSIRGERAEYLHEYAQRLQAEYGADPLAFEDLDKLGRLRQQAEREFAYARFASPQAFHEAASEITKQLSQPSSKLGGSAEPALSPRRAR